MNRREIKAALQALQVPIPIDTVTPELERMLQVATVQKPTPRKAK